MKKPPDTSLNKSVLDAWSAIHFASGALLGVLGVSTGATLAISTVYEIAEWYHEYPRGSKIFGTKRPESIQNALADTGLVMLGHYLTKQKLCCLCG